MLPFRGLEGQKINNQFDEAVIVIREFWKMSESQQKTLTSEGITRHIWEKCPWAGHSVFFRARAWEIGRMSAYVKNYASTEDKVAFQRELKAQKEVGWLRDIPAPYEPQDDSPEGLERSVIEKNEYMKDEGEVRMFQLFAEGIEDLYTGMIDKFVRDTAALWDEFAMRIESGEYYLVDPDPYAPTPTVPTSANICLDIHNNVKFSPKLCLWAIEQKLESTGEHFAQGQFAEFCYQELKGYVQNRAEIDDSFYKHLVINTQSSTFEDANYVNTIGSKVVIKPVGEIMELSVKKEKTLQRTMVIHQPEQASSTQDTTGDLSSDKIPEASMDEVTGDLASGKIPESQIAEPTEDLPSGEISVEKAKEEDVEMEVKEEEDIPQDEQMQEDEEEPDYAESELSEGAMLRANEVATSELIDIMALESDEDAVLDPRPRIANKVMARFLNSMMRNDLGRIDAMLQGEREAREQFHQQRREEEQRHESASASGHLPPGETPDVPGSSGHLPSGEIPDVPIEQGIKEEQPAPKGQVKK